MPNNRERILSRLQVALRDEQITALCYDLRANIAHHRGQMGLSVRLRGFERDHRAHGELIAERIRKLGGDAPGAEPFDAEFDRVRCPADVETEEILEHALRLEDAEIESYENLARQADTETAGLCHHCGQEDRQHADWIRARILQGLPIDEALGE